MLQLGYQGKDVSTLQHVLNVIAASLATSPSQQQYWRPFLLDEDGIFGTKTQATLTRIEIALNMPRKDGVADDSVYKAIQQYINSNELGTFDFSNGLNFQSSDKAALLLQQLKAISLPTPSVAPQPTTSRPSLLTLPNLLLGAIAYWFWKRAKKR